MESDSAVIMGLNGFGVVLRLLKSSTRGVCLIWSSDRLFNADHEFLPQPFGGFGAGVTGHGAVVSAPALHASGEYGAVAGGAAADGNDRRVPAAAAQHQHHGENGTAARGPAAVLQGGFARGQRWKTDSTQVRSKIEFINHCNVSFSRYVLVSALAVLQILASTLPRRHFGASEI